MKKLILFLFSILFLAACRKTDFKSTAVDNPKKATTVNILNTMDTTIVKIDTEAHKLYFIQDSLVVREFKWYNNNDVTRPIGVILLLCFLFWLLGVVVAARLFS